MMERAREYAQLLVVFVILIAIIAGAAWVIEVTGTRAKWEAQAELNRAARIQQQAELLEQKQQGWLLMPGIVASLADTAISTTLSIAGWFTTIAIIVFLIVDRRQQDAEKRRSRADKD